MVYSSVITLKSPSLVAKIVAGTSGRRAYEGFQTHRRVESNQSSDDFPLDEETKTAILEELGRKD